MSERHAVNPPVGPLAAIWVRHRGALSLTYALTAVENCFTILYPAAVGYAVDGLLSARTERLVPLIILWSSHLVVGLSRHLYDTRVFTTVYGALAGEMVERQRGEGVDAGHIIGRVGLSREVVEFFEEDLPAIAKSAIGLVGAVAMLALYDLWLGSFAIAALLPIAIASRRFGRRSYRLNAGLNNRIEREADIVGVKPMRAVRRHFVRLRFWRLRISNAEAATWCVIELSVIALVVAVLLRLTSVPGVTAGTIYAVLAYVFALDEVVDELPVLIQNTARVHDIGGRIVEAE